ncbi:tail fiber assembly protein [Pseudomonas sp. NPDC086251]|jgi:hypothetical protein|uniref:tail fiber assembly protein n=1 Tax=Pseudomonas sp. NPDC086251 TaxID=3364431 RepID=UPI003834C25E
MVYYYVNQFTQELQGPVDLQPGPGGELPYNAVELPQALPSAETGYVWVWREGAAQQLIDLRNKPFYRKDNGQLFFMYVPGPLSDFLTDKPYPGVYYFWMNDDWVLDVAAERAGKIAEAVIERDQRLSRAVIRVAPLQYADDFNEATSTQLATLSEWKRYVLSVAAIDQQPDYPYIINWPSAPDAVIAP